VEASARSAPRACPLACPWMPGAQFRAGWTLRTSLAPPRRRPCQPCGRGSSQARAIRRSRTHSRFRYFSSQIVGSIRKSAAPTIARAMLRLQVRRTSSSRPRACGLRQQPSHRTLARRVVIGQSSGTHPPMALPRIRVLESRGQQIALDGCDPRSLSDLGQSAATAGRPVQKCAIARYIVPLCSSQSRISGLALPPSRDDVPKSDRLLAPLPAAVQKIYTII
jgi:hypothetical protein